MTAVMFNIFYFFSQHICRNSIVNFAKFFFKTANIPAIFISFNGAKNQ